MTGSRTARAFRQCATLLSLCLSLAALPARGTVVAGSGLNFTASTLGFDSTAVPPDCNGAVGPTNFVEFINGRFAVFDKASGARVQNFSDGSFWSRAGAPISPGFAVTDPRIIYDPVSQRWFAVQIDFDPTLTINSNHFLLAVSSTMDPTGAWKGLKITADPTVSSTADFPTLGLDSQGVYISGVMFDANNTLVGTTLISIPKTNLLTIPPSATGMTRFANLSVASRGVVFQPAVALDGSAGGNVLSTASLGADPNTGDFLTNTSLVSFKVQNPAGPGSAALSGAAFVTVQPYTAPLDPPQPDGSTNIADNDARFSANVYQVGGVLYAVHNTQLGARAVVRWYRLDANTAAVLESGTIADPVLDLFYPSIAANANGTVVIGCNGCSLSSYVSCYALVGETVNGVTTFGSPMLLQAGVASYQDGSQESRWGDYSTTTVDAADPTSFWTIQMYPAAGMTWSTQVTQIRTAPLQLSIAPAGTNVLLSWTSLAGGAQLQTKSGVSADSAWASVTQSAVTNGGVISVLVPASSAPQFFRLKL